MSELYKQAGVDIRQGEVAVGRIKRHAQKTFGSGVLQGIGNFSSAFALDTKKFSDPVLISGTDGVGTKLLPTYLLNRHDRIGIDLVAMCVNDVVTSGAEPLFFQDYIACDRILPERIEAIISGIAEGCMQAGCSLTGGEIAEMPDLYASGHYDLAGFCVGAVNRSEMIDLSQVKEGDRIVGLSSSGFHSNGFSLIRKIYSIRESGPISKEEEEKLLEWLTPTRIYVRSILDARKKKIAIRSMAHITGGGFYENIPRALPAGLCFEVEPNWEIPVVFNELQKIGRVPLREMYTVFNMGIGMVVVVAPEESTELIEFFEQAGEKAQKIGSVKSGNTSKILGID